MSSRIETDADKGADPESVSEPGKSPSPGTRLRTYDEPIARRRAADEAGQARVGSRSLNLDDTGDVYRAMRDAATRLRDGTMTEPTGAEASALPGTRVLGMTVIYVFLAAIGAHAELGALVELGRLGLVLLIFASILVLVHGLVTFGLGRLLRQDPDLVAVASQANIGGSTSALAVAKSLGRTDLLLPAILVGSLGIGLGTYLGFLVAGVLGAAVPG